MSKVTIELSQDEQQKVERAMWELYDQHRGDGNTQKAQEYKELYEKVHKSHS